MTQASNHPALDVPVSAGPAGALRSAVRQALMISLVFGQFFVLASVIKEFHFVSAVFQRVVFLAVFAFAIHHLLPSRARMPFFCVLSWFSIAVGSGCTRTEWATGLMTTGAVVGAGLILIGPCHAPIPFGWRIVAIPLVGFGLMVVRAKSHGAAEGTSVHDGGNP